MLIKKFEAVATILGVERAVKYDGVMLSVEIAAGEVNAIMGVLESLAVRAAPSPPASTNGNGGARKEEACTEQAPANANTGSVASASTDGGASARGATTISTAASESGAARAAQNTATEPLPPVAPEVQDIDQPYQAAEPEVVAADSDAATEVAPERTRVTINEDDMNVARGASTMRKVLDHLRAKKGIDSAADVYAACETMANLDNPPQLITRLLEAGTLKTRIEAALTAMGK